MVIEEFKLEEMLSGINPEVKQNKKILGENSISYIILQVHHDEFLGETPCYFASILGKPTISYVKKACESIPKTLEIAENADVVKEIKPLLSNKEWTIVLFSDTPLLTTGTLAEAFLYASKKNLNVCKLKRGYIFKTEYIKRVDRIFEVESIKCVNDDFFEVRTQADLAEATKIMKNRVVTNLLLNGVQIIDPSSTYIESCVTIDKGCVIYPNAAIMGDTKIGHKSIIGFGSIIKNAVIGEKCNIQNSFITNSAILDSTLVESSRIENNSLVEKNCVIKHYSIISSAKVGKNCKISWSKVKGVAIADNSKIEN